MCVATLVSKSSFQVRWSRTGYVSMGQASPFTSLGLSFPLRMRGLGQRFPLFFSALFLCSSVMMGEEVGRGRHTQPRTLHPNHHLPLPAKPHSPAPSFRLCQSNPRRGGDERRCPDVQGGGLG